ncbi:MAG: serine acetyltransferase [Nitrospinae bacterium]|nr:serine acetyltransferase [Nitrospinota bacterium]
MDYQARELGPLGGRLLNVGSSRGKKLALLWRIGFEEVDTIKACSTYFWSTIRSDVGRLREEDPSFRALIRGLLSQGFLALLGYRIFRWFLERHIPTQPFRFLIERFIEITTGISIPAQVQIGKGLRIHHFGGIVIHSDVVIGAGCTIYQGVTLGDLGGWGGAPQIGNQVLIGAGAKVLGGITVGDYCRIGANAVVRTSVPAGCLAVGIPAVIKPGAVLIQQNSV